MLMKIIYLFLSIFLCIYIPEKFKLITNLLQELGIKIAYNIIYFYSVCQIKCNQLYNFTLPYLKKYNIFSFMPDSLETSSTSNPEVEIYDLITNKTVFEGEYSEAFDEMKLNNKMDKIIIISHPSCINKKILYELEPLNKELEESEISFIALYLNYNNARYHINLKTDKYNYYLVGNVINKLFLQYYINSALNHTNFVIDDTKPYSLELMDHEVNMIYLDIEDSIIIEKNGYHINDKKRKDEVIINELDKMNN